MDCKEELLSVLEIAEINFLMSLKDLKPELVNRGAVENVNTIAWIVGHCLLNYDICLSLYTDEQVLTEEETEYYIYGTAKEELKDSSLPFVKLIDLSLEFWNKLFKIFEGLDEEKFDEIPHEKAKGKLSDIIKSIALHTMGHTGQIVLIRRMLDDPFWSFIQGVPQKNRVEFRKEWITWWEENKTIYQ